MIRRIIGYLIPFILLGTAAIIITFGRGYRIDFVEKEVKSTGILVAASEPDGAQVFIDNKFTGATNSNISLDPGQYEVKIKKEGYQDWVKKVRIRGEGVVKTNAVLFRSNPSLAPLINSEVLEPILSPDGTKIVYMATPSANPREGIGNLNFTLDKPTLFVFDLTTRTNPFNKNPRPYEGTLVELLRSWLDEDKTLKEITFSKFPEEFISVASASGKIIAFSPDESKVLYEATASAKLAIVINPPLIGADSIAEKRDLEKGKIYIYDLKEDKNYEIEGLAIPKEEEKKAAPTKRGELISPTPILPKRLSFGWFGNSLNLYLIEDNTISIMEYTGENKIIVYSGPFIDQYVFPHPNGRELIILTTLNPVASPNPSLYTLNVR